MMKDKIVISSPDGLHEEFSEEDFLQGSYSSLRNPIIANVFHHLGIVEIFATGIRRIKEAFASSSSKPLFYVSESSVQFVLPIIEEALLTSEEKLLVKTMVKSREYSRAELEKLTGMGKSKLIRIINPPIGKGVLKKSGAGPSATYF